ncbi:DUF4345 domain-containing protein [Streptomyces sp. NPDC018031]|uniref:DUF4345 domain-containing protein n=1 Tax=Streptomyces sp. NPDC018031 TaxID=3365033 RepID=UPI0037ABBFDD
MSSRDAFRGTLAVLGLIVVGTGVPDVVAGPGAVPGSHDVGATLDSNYRFFAGVWCALGLALLAAARQPEEHAPVLRAVFGAVFAGGLTRGVSCVAVGTPHALYASFIAVELLLPPLLMLWYGRLPAARERTVAV